MNKDSTHHADHGKERKHVPQKETDLYTCPMHPEVKQTGPGSCPKCGMALEPKGGAGQSVVSWNLNMFTLIGLGVSVAYIYSLIAAIFPDLFPASMGILFRNAEAIVNGAEERGIDLVEAVDFESKTASFRQGCVGQYFFRYSSVKPNS